MKLLPDLGTYFVEQGWTAPARLQVPKGTNVTAVKGNTHAISFSTCAITIGATTHLLPEIFIGTIEYKGSFEIAKKIAQQLLQEGVECQVKPNKAYNAIGNPQDKVIPFWLIHQPKKPSKGFGAV